jgi:hypothetical protein
MAVSPETAERQMLANPGAFSQCVAGVVEPVNGEAARVWSYVTLLAPTPTPSKIWISVARGLPLKVQAATTLQISTYQAAPYAIP